jgi:hypothetical protein
MALILDVDDSPSVLSPAHGFAIDHNASLGADHSERQHFLTVRLDHRVFSVRPAYPDASVESVFLLVVLFGVEGIQADLVVLQLGHDLE